MNIKYEIQSIKNSQGTNKERHFVRIFDHSPLTAQELKSQIQTSCTLTEADIEATLTALRKVMIRELSQGNRFYIPSIGYLSLAVGLEMPEEKPIEKVRGDNVRVRNINFRPDASMLQEIRENTRFERADFTTKSKNHTEAEFLEGIKAHLTTHHYLNRRDMENLFGLRQNAALKWLKHFTETGVLKKDGAKNAPIYFWNE